MVTGRWGRRRRVSRAGVTGRVAVWIGRKPWRAFVWSGGGDCTGTQIAAGKPAPPRFSHPPCGRAAPGPNTCDCAAPAFAGKPAPTISFPAACPRFYATPPRDTAPSRFSHPPCGRAAPVRIRAIAPRRHSRASPLLRFRSLAACPRFYATTPTGHRSVPIFAPPLWEGRPRPECVRLRRAGIRGQARSYDFVPLRPAYGFTRQPPRDTAPPRFSHPPVGEPPPARMRAIAPRRNSRASPLLRFRSLAACLRFYATPPRDTAPSRFSHPPVGGPPPARMGAIAPRRHSRASPLLRFRSLAACPRFYATPPRDTSCRSGLARDEARGEPATYRQQAGSYRVNAVWAEAVKWRDSKFARGRRSLGMGARADYFCLLSSASSSACAQ
jgi:hypothetical protein